MNIFDNLEHVLTAFKKGLRLWAENFKEASVSKITWFWIVIRSFSHIIYILDSFWHEGNVNGVTKMYSLKRSSTPVKKYQTKNRFFLAFSHVFGMFLPYLELKHFTGKDMKNKLAKKKVLIDSYKWGLPKISIYIIFY